MSGRGQVFKHNKGIALGFLSTALGALITILYKPMMSRGMPAISIALIECTTIMLLLLTLCKPWRLLRSPKRIWHPIMLSSICQAVGGISYFFGLSYLDPVTFSFLTRNQAIFAIVLGFFFLGERHNLSAWVFIVLAVIGSLILCYADANTMHPIGVLFALIFCACFGMRNFILRKHAHIPVLVNLFYGYLLSVVLLLLLASFNSSYQFHSVSSADLLKIATVAIFASFGTLYFFQLALRFESVSIISPLRLFSPYIVAIYFGWEIGYNYTQDKMLGMVVMTMAIMALMYNSKQKYNASIQAQAASSNL